jgi:hypothetical protein
MTYEGLLTVGGQLPLESDHSRCSGLVHCGGKRQREVQLEIDADTYSRGLP